VALAITEDHRVLADVARSLVGDRGVRATARAALDRPSDELPGYWKDLVAAGWTGLAVPEEHGGQGYGLAELALVVAELGRAQAPAPFLSTAVTTVVLAETASDEQRARWLPRLAGGASVAAVGMAGTVRTDGSTADGDAGPVVGAGPADLLVLAAGEDVVLVAHGVGVEVNAGPVDPLVRRVRLTGAPVADVLPGAAGALGRTLRALAAAEAAGGMEACLEATVSYAGQRSQFGRLIGSFQAVKHHCADMAVETELATAAAWDAARAATGSEEAASSAVHAADLAATLAVPAYRRVAERTVQVHGGVAYTWEHDAHLALRRALALQGATGGPHEVAGRVTAARRAGVCRDPTVELPAGAETYRRDARAFVARYGETPERERRALFAESGYLVPHWPPPYGRGADPVEQLVIEEELAALDRPSLGLGEWVLPTLLSHGTDEQRERWLWPSLRGELRWCQLFSEPGAGSDAAAVTTRGRRVEGGWSVTGQKVWTSDAQNCHRGLATVRTDPDRPKHRGIAAMVIDLSAPGVELRPLTEITGEALFNEVFLDAVFVPDADVVGAVDEGWRVARSTLGNERVSIGSGSVTMVADDLIAVLERHRPDDAGAAREVGTLLAEAHGLRAVNLRRAASAAAGAEPGPEGSLAKLFGAEHAQRVVETGMRLAAIPAVLGDEPTLVHDYLFARCLTIAGGTSEVLRTQIGERILGLPREPA
jgi:alkylation response protein AidB-like acyl-CoA dehydrogenase